MHAEESIPARRHELGAEVARRGEGTWPVLRTDAAATSDA